MKWEDLKVYRPLPKEELRQAFKPFTAAVAAHLAPYGFILLGRKLIRAVNDVMQIIHIDTRGSWMGISATYETGVAVIPYCSDFFRLTSSSELLWQKPIEEIVPGIKNHYRITAEYVLLAEYLAGRIIRDVLPYFNSINTSAQILSHWEDLLPKRRLFPGEAFAYDIVLLYCSLKNNKPDAAIPLLSALRQHLEGKSGNRAEKLGNELDEYRQLVEQDDWKAIHEKLLAAEQLELRKCKLKL
ncbi:hypothetical protein F0P96_17820 [Hymenobacter busanensis]|uniref:Uncharacterized protein n=1 Tax=Hymenobacter busanensis TaxID=2607656 RepID=A0A7L4ZUB4_9BACT|nr:hypothetical protein [Hymenobacter busanensis]KAA9327097.1 hypothetical protein F0P96_17820 [Hymenobacter busanensis]QHJ05762.1 hypothetical protein GUY19_00020 [Hymenobacter busanensis]